MNSITLDQANIAIAGAIAKGRELGLRPLSVAIVDPGGHLIAFQREDGASFGRLQIALGKTVGALAVGVSSRKLGDMAIERPWFVGALAASASHPVIPAAGGVIIVDDSNIILGGIGVTGDTSDNDELSALAGIAAAGLKAQT